MGNIKVFILTEGSHKVGFGHITRMLAIYQAFEEKGIKPKFIINGDESIKDLVKETNYEIYDWIKNSDKLFSQIKDADIAIIDSYLADLDIYKRISELVKLPIYYDDNNRLEYPRGIVINGNIHATSLDYSKKDDAVYLLGARYTPLRKEFWDVPNIEIKENIEVVMVTFGGDDMSNMTPKVLKILAESYPNLEKKVIIGRAFNNINKIRLAANKNTELIYYPDAKKMLEVMLESDIAISAGGQTLYELARVGVPTITIAVAENQMGNIRGWQKKNFIEYAGWWEEREILSNVDFTFSKLSSFDERKKRGCIGKKIVDGRGAKRIANLIKKDVMKL